MLGRPNLLVLDEPTNHLDIESVEVLEKAIEEFTGTVVAISHDRYFLDRIADRIVEVRETRVTRERRRLFGLARAQGLSPARRGRTVPGCRRRPCATGSARSSGPTRKSSGRCLCFLALRNVTLDADEVNARAAAGGAAARHRRQPAAAARALRPRRHRDRPGPRLRPAPAPSSARAWTASSPRSKGCEARPRRCDCCAATRSSPGNAPRWPCSPRSSPTRRRAAARSRSSARRRRRPRDLNVAADRAGAELDDRGTSASAGSPRDRAPSSSCR